MSFVKLAYKTFSVKGASNLQVKNISNATSPKNNIYIAHGMLGNAMNWASVAKKLLEQSEIAHKVNTIYSLDMRNHGKSPHSNDHSNAALASDLEAFVLEHQVKQHREENANHQRGNVFIGHSMGGLALIGMLLRRYNERLLLQSPDDESTHLHHHDSNNTNSFNEELSKLDAIWRADRRIAYSTHMREVNRYFGFAEDKSLQQILFKYNVDKTNSNVNNNSHDDNSDNAAAIVGHLSAAIIVDITPTALVDLNNDESHQSHTSKNENNANKTESKDSNWETLQAMQAARLDRIHSYTEADVELKCVGISDPALRSFVATNIVLSKDRMKPAYWRCNLDVLVSNFHGFQPSIVNWFVHFSKLYNTSSSTTEPYISAKSNSNVNNNKNNNNNTNNNTNNINNIITTSNYHNNKESDSNGEALITPRPCLLPTLFVFGEKSIYNNAQDRQKISFMFPRSTQITVPNAGHFVHYEQRDSFVNAITPFLSQYLENTNRAI